MTEIGFYMENVAKGSILNQFSEFSNHWIVTLVMTERQLDTSLLRSRYSATGIVNVQRKGFFRIDMLAGFGRLDDLLCMKGMRCRQGHGINIWVSQNFFNR